MNLVPLQNSSQETFALIDSKILFCPINTAISLSPDETGLSMFSRYSVWELLNKQRQSHILHEQEQKQWKAHSFYFGLLETGTPTNL